MSRFLILFASLVLWGCDTTPETYETVSQRSHERLDVARAKQSSPSTAQHVVRAQGYFVPPLHLPEQDGPAWMALPVQFAFEDYPLGRALNDLLAPEGISVRLLDDIESTLPISLRHEGSIGEALMQIGLMTGFSYTTESRLVTFRQYEVAEFDVAFLAGVTNFFLGEDGSQTGGNTGQAGQNVVVSGAGVNDESRQFLNFTSEALSVWSDLEHALGLLLSEQGQVAINQSSTSVLVRDLPQHVQLVREYLLQQNQRLTRQVAIDIQVIDVTFTEGEQTGIDWALVHEKTGGNRVLNLFQAGAGNILGSNQGAGLAARQQQGAFSGSEVLLQALREQGVVEVSNHPRMVTLNNQISKVVLEENVTYLASAGSSSTANVGSSDLLIPGVVRTGFELFVLPKISNEQVLLQVSTGLSDLLGIDEVTSGETTIQTPQTTRKKFFMKSLVGNEQTLLISGLKSGKRHWQNEEGILPWIFGGNRRSTSQRTETIVLLTPRILHTGAIL
ncbi:MAG: type 2a secretion system secretin PulD [Idiomarinaceae bacterium HL-53]|nr:MAG: type 2a secretion system secretin PulD [Idiomarinaceae bacterium HL-53]CUS49394.1 type IVB pilus formation outer membrane protein, R64 PilN family [Idiomarinaceae bacterium HL-53]